MKIKYNPSETPFIGKHQGGIFQKYAGGWQLMPNKKNDRNRYPIQNDMMSVMSIVSRAWSQLSATQKLAWSAWVAAYPQETKHNSLVFLNAYQNFVKRNFYELLFFGRNANLITTPVLVSVSPDTVTPSLSVNAGQLILDYSWSRGGADIWAGVFVSHVISQGKLYQFSQPRFIGVIDNGGGFAVKFGILYNWAVTQLTGVNSITSSDNWVVPSYANMVNFFSFIGTLQGYNARFSGTDLWKYDQGTNTLPFNLPGAGSRSQTNGAFIDLTTYCKMWTTTSRNSSLANVYHTVINSKYFGLPGGWYKPSGVSLRLCNPSTTLPNGFIGSYTGNDGKNYLTKVFGNIEFTLFNLCESKLRSGYVLQNITDNLLWTTIGSAARCDFNNDPSMSFTSGSTSYNASEGFEKNFGIIPNVGDYLLVKFVKVGKVNGQFLEEQQFTLPIA